ncbi:MAG: STAS domain-containing protein [Pseudomonadales bacterium]|uniref:Anti-sigma factor antagonist n=1 Tax=Oleiphilus messinensis TaxID=141451 RepID=A0A1Y0I714_9GAMM|nr:STAS domain-containing protein [Oleiphilus messinensis]ARU56278.1 anti-sigma factor antagonist [Oleiphilus messinensis]MCG8610735.1 STAS domain-containing protein [Pseudomonadales bacterium]
MAISKREVSTGELHISISGLFDFNSVQEFRSCYDQSNKYKKYVMDMSQVDHIDSSALGMLLNMKKTVGDGVSIHIRNCKPGIKKIFMISRFDKKFTFD